MQTRIGLKDFPRSSQSLDLSVQDRIKRDTLFAFVLRSIERRQLSYRHQGTLVIKTKCSKKAISSE